MIRKRLFLLLVALLVATPFFAQEKNAKYYKSTNHLQELVDNGWLSAQEAETIIERNKIEASIKEQNELAQKANPEMYSNLQNLVEQYKTERVPELNALGYAITPNDQNQIRPEQISIPPFVITLLDGFIPWIINAMGTDSVPNKLQFFQWLNLSQDYYKKNAEFRAFVNQKFGIVE